MLPLIGVFKLVKALLLFAVALSVMRLVHGDAPAVIDHWTRELHIDPDGRHFGRVLQRLLSLDERHVRAITAGMIVYASVFTIEGVGLILRQRWAEWFTVIVTASFVPVEVYEIVRRPGAVRVAALAVNLAIVWYLVVRLRKRLAKG